MKRNDLPLEVGKTYDVISGIVQQFDRDYQIIPRSSADIIEDATTVQPVVASAEKGLYRKRHNSNINIYYSRCNHLLYNRWY